MAKPWRFINPDGSFNIERRGVEYLRFTDVYHTLLAMSWKRFILVIFSFYLVANLVFAFCYLLCGNGALDGVTGSLRSAQADSFFFSVQTLATIGYGKITPVSLAANFIVTIEALSGMLLIALASGLLYARFARPTARIVFSNRAIITEHFGEKVFMFRLANARMNQISEARIELMLIKNETSAEGIQYRNFYPMKLESDHSPIFALSWMIIHPIDKESPLYGVSLDELRAQETEITATLLGMDETFATTIHARRSYTADEILLNTQFKDIITRTERGKLTLDVRGIHSMQSQ